MREGQMWRLVIFKDQQPRQVVWLKRREHTIGKHDADIRLNYDQHPMLISRQHAVLKPVGEDGWEITDESVNGTFVNGVRIEGNHSLQSRDCLVFGHFNSHNIPKGQEAKPLWAFGFSMQILRPGDCSIVESGLPVIKNLPVTIEPWSFNIEIIKIENGRILAKRVKRLLMDRCTDGVNVKVVAIRKSSPELGELDESDNDEVSGQTGYHLDPKRARFSNRSNGTEVESNNLLSISPPATFNIERVSDDTVDVGVKSTCNHINDVEIKNRAFNNRADLKVKKTCNITTGMKVKLACKESADVKIKMTCNDSADVTTANRTSNDNGDVKTRRASNADAKLIMTSNSSVDVTTANRTSNDYGDVKARRARNTDAKIKMTSNDSVDVTTVNRTSNDNGDVKARRSSNADTKYKMTSNDSVDVTTDNRTSKDNGGVKARRSSNTDAKYKMMCNDNVDVTTDNITSNDNDDVKARRASNADAKFKITSNGSVDVTKANRTSNDNGDVKARRASNAHAKFKKTSNASVDVTTANMTSNDNGGAKARRASNTDAKVKMTSNDRVGMNRKDDPDACNGRGNGGRSSGEINSSKAHIIDGAVIVGVLTNSQSLANDSERDDDDDEDNYHEDETACAAGLKCKLPRARHLKWVMCDYCQNWYHSVCVSYRSNSSRNKQNKEFNCGCTYNKGGQTNLHLG